MPTSRSPKKRASSTTADKNKRTVGRKSALAAKPLVRRDQATGRLISATGEAAILRGGHYHLFQSDSQCTRRLVADKGRRAISVDYGSCYPCAPNPAAGDPPLPASKPLLWIGEQQQEDGWTDLFTALTQNGINLLRVFMFNGFGIKDGAASESTDELYPFNTYLLTPPPPAGGPPGKAPKGILLWRVQEAVESDVWNAAYFQRLRRFAEKARKNNVSLQLSLFNYYELNDGGGSAAPYTDPWLLSFWNPTRNYPADWGRQNLLNLPDNLQNQSQRQLEFVTAQYSTGLRRTQEKIVRKVVRELQGLPNIILEVMNEPHQGTHRQTTEFSSAVVGWIVDEAAKSSSPERPMISVNATLRNSKLKRDCPDADEFDVDWWAANTSVVKNYESVDIISYHGLTGYDPYAKMITCECQNPSRKKTTFDGKFPRVSRNDITARYQCFRKKHPTKAIIMSTDAVSVEKYNHVYGDYDMNLRDGQIVTGLGNAGGTDDDQRTRSDLENWAYWCFVAPLAVDKGVIHFQNHSTFEATYAAISRAFSSSGR